MSRQPAALAIFARTPQWSAPKTRLAADAGAAAASKLYGLALECAADLGRQLQESGWSVSWAVAEPGGYRDEFWRESGLPAVSSGRGGLGSRLASTYSRLLKRGEAALMIGSDSPQLSAERMQEAARKARELGLAAGPATDGGFYVFAGSLQLDPGVWRGVAYSRPDTLQSLLGQLPQPAALLKPEPDFDDLASLAAVVAAMPVAPTPAQEQFSREAGRILAGQSG